MESDLEKAIEEFKQKLEMNNFLDKQLKRKLKPNISNDWLRELKSKLKVNLK
jgi:hypothetical protein